MNIVNWIVVKKFPLTTDLTHITGFLRERHIEHRIYEEAGEQILAVKDARMLGPIAQFVSEVEQGTLVIGHQATDNNQELPNTPSVMTQIKAAPLSAILILLSAIGALIVAVDDNYTWVHWLSFQDIYYNRLASLGESLGAGQFWRFITPAFLHFGFLHFLFNSLWVWDLGRRLELLLGRTQYILFFVVTASLSNLAQYLWINQSLFGGMSGVVYAFIGFIIVSHRLAPNKLTAVPPAILGFMLFWLVLCMTGVVDYFIGGGIANAAHLGGLAAGCVFALLRGKPKKSFS